MIIENIPCRGNIASRSKLRVITIIDSAPIKIIEVRPRMQTSA
jgi:hypothetical protein